MKHLHSLLFVVPLCGSIAIGCGSESPLEPDAGITNPRDGAAPDAALPDAGAPIEPRGPAFGLLQFDVVHNLADDACLARGDCSLTTEPDETGAWAAELAGHSSHATFHWDRPIPWLAFAERPPEGMDRVTFYEARLDAELLGWIDGFAAAVDSSGPGYAAVSILDGSRDRVSPIRLSPEADNVPIADACNDMAPGTELVVDHVLAAGEAFDLVEAYGNLALYVNDKLRPRHLGLLVETNAFRVLCPEKWPGLVALYHAVYDRVRAEVDEATTLFATLTYADLLGYDFARCHGRLATGSCEVPAEPLPADAARCFDFDPQPILDLNEGERLEVLALSFYPDSLLMQVPGLAGATLTLNEIGPDADVGACSNRFTLAHELDPLAEIDRLGWDKPIAIAEWSARSCSTVSWFSPGGQDLLGSLPSTPGSQEHWMRKMLSEADARDFLFVNYSFLRDYAPLGPWLVQRGVMTTAQFRQMNIWPCSGLYTEGDGHKGAVTDLWESRVARAREERPTRP